MDNRLFSLMVVPDSGHNVKSGSFSFKLLLYSVSFLALTFLICLFFIVGYHIKLNQELEYNNSISKMYKLENHITKSKKLIDKISKRLSLIQRNDVAFRQFAYMNIPDSKMYEAGIGGHEIVDDSRFFPLDKNYREDVKQIAINIKINDSRLKVQDSSLDEIYKQLKLNQDILNNTPSGLPANSFKINSDFSWRIHPITGLREFHPACDIAGSRGDDIYATADGEIIFADGDGSYGKCIRIAHKYGFETLYGHLDFINVTVGQKVKKHDIIGRMGSTGRATGVHVHYSVYHFGKVDDPKKYF
jgi:murein DD-endopeptidase MepM/ murein hydrolase activator NlpD